MKGKGEKQELKHAVIGMDRLENIYKKLGLYESIVIIINSTIINSDISRKIDIKIDEVEKEFVIRISGKSLPKVIGFEREVNINENLLLMAMTFLCTKISIISTQNNTIKFQKLSLKKINESLFSEEFKEDIGKENSENNIAFIIKEYDFTPSGKEVLNIKNVSVKILVPLIFLKAAVKYPSKVRMSFTRINFISYL